MNLTIQKDSLVEDVNKVFTGCYPFLKIELYKKPVVGNHTIKKEALPLNLPLMLFANLSDKKVIDINIDINNAVTVAELESQFDLIGLLAEVFRKSGNVWIETTLTSSWTLHQQNTEGEEISKHFEQKKISFT